MVLFQLLKMLTCTQIKYHAGARIQKKTCRKASYFIETSLAWNVTVYLNKTFAIQSKIPVNQSR